MSASVSTLLDLPTETLRDLVAVVAGRDVGRPLDGRVVAVLPFAAAALPPAAWIAAAQRLGAGILRLSDIDGATEGGEGSELALCDQAARWADVLVTAHRSDGFARAVADRTGLPVVNAGEAAEDPATGLSLLAAIVAIHRAEDDAAVREPHVAVCGDLRGSTSARSLLSALAAIEASVLLVPAKGRDLPDDELQRLARRTRRRPVRFEARSMRSLLDMVDTVLLAPDAAPQLPLFREVGVPPGEAERRARREVEDTDALFVAAGGSVADRLVATPFRGRSVPEGRAHAVGPRAPLALLAFAAGPPAPRDDSGIRARYRSPLGLRCRGADCISAALPDAVHPDFAIVGGDDVTLECAYCGARVRAEWSGSSEAGRHHPVSSADARRILPQNRVLFRSRAEALALGFEASRRDALTSADES